MSNDDRYLLLKSMYKEVTKINDNIALYTDDYQTFNMISLSNNCVIHSRNFNSNYNMASRYHMNYISDAMYKKLSRGFIALLDTYIHTVVLKIADDNGNIIIDSSVLKCGVCENRKINDTCEMFMFRNHTNSNIKCIIFYDTINKKVERILYTIVKSIKNKNKLTIYFYEDGVNKTETYTFRR